MNLTNDVIVNKSFLHKDAEERINDNGLEILQTGNKNIETLSNRVY